MTQKHPYLIDRTWEHSEDTLPVTNPYTQQVFAEVCLANAATIDRAIASAHKAFETTRKLPSYKRAQLCNEVAERIKTRREEFAETITLESGKPLVYSRGEVARTISTFQIAAEEASRIHGEVLNLDITEAAAGKSGLVQRFPLGPISAISPFNFPLNLVAHKVAPALAVGNPMVLKPSSFTPLTALLLGRVLCDAGIPEGMMSILPCRTDDAKALVEDDRFKMITFSGSPPVGWYIKANAGRKRVTLELGGNAGVIIEPDSDLDLAARRVCFGAFSYSGQVCISVQRTYVHESIFDEFKDKLLKEVSSLKRGDPLDESTTIGPLIDLENAKRIEQWVDEAVTAGAELLTGGKRNGTFVEPAVLTRVSPKVQAFCQEAFGPLLILEPYSDFEKAVEQVNNSAFGLQAGVFTNQIDKAFRAFNNLEVGGVVLNDVPTFRVDNMPYGGVKDSGFGREGVKYTIEEMTEIKLMVMDKYQD